MSTPRRSASFVSQNNLEELIRILADQQHPLTTRQDGTKVQPSESAKPIFFTGAGLTRYLIGDGRNTTPLLPRGWSMLWFDLVDDLADLLPSDLKQQEDDGGPIIRRKGLTYPPEVWLAIAKDNQPEEFRNRIASLFLCAPDNFGALQKALGSDIALKERWRVLEPVLSRGRAIVTTNFDPCLQIMYALQDTTVPQHIMHVGDDFTRLGHLLTPSSDSNMELVHLHGAAHDKDHPYYQVSDLVGAFNLMKSVMTMAEYSVGYDWANGNLSRLSWLRQLFEADASCVFVGYALNDYLVRMAVQLTQRNKPEPHHFIIFHSDHPSPDAEVMIYERIYNVRPIVTNSLPFSSHLSKSEALAEVFKELHREVGAEVKRRRSSDMGHMIKGAMNEQQ